MPACLACCSALLTAFAVRGDEDALVAAGDGVVDRGDLGLGVAVLLARGHREVDAGLVGRLLGVVLHRDEVRVRQCLQDQGDADLAAAAPASARSARARRAARREGERAAEEGHGGHDVATHSPPVLPRVRCLHTKSFRIFARPPVVRTTLSPRYSATSPGRVNTPPDISWSRKRNVSDSPPLTQGGPFPSLLVIHHEIAFAPSSGVPRRLCLPRDSRRQRCPPCGDRRAAIVPARDCIPALARRAFVGHARPAAPAA